MNILTWIISLLAILIIYWLAFAYYKIHVSGKLVRNAVPFSVVGNNYTKTLLVLGDSTAVGVGASNSSDSIPAKISSYLGATYVENHAVSGSLVRDLSSQIKLLTRDHYNIILLQIGANDIIRFHTIETIEKELDSILFVLTQKSKKVIFISAGNVGGAPLIPPPLRPFYTRLNLLYHTNFEALAKKHGVTYINMYQDPSVDPFIKDPRRHFAEDSFHPSSLGYDIWFTTIQKRLEQQN